MKKRSTYKKKSGKGLSYKTVRPFQEMMQLGNYLRSLREDLDLTLRKAAELARISPAHLCKIEQGTIFRSIGIGVLIRLTHVYNIPLSSILEEAKLIKENESKLPEFTQYLRAKYNLSPQAIRDLETTKEVVLKKYRRKENIQTSLF